MFDAPSDNAPSDNASDDEGGIVWGEGRMELLRNRYLAYSGDMYSVLAGRLSAEFEIEVPPEDIQRQCRGLALGFPHVQIIPTGNQAA